MAATCASRICPVSESPSASAEPPSPPLCPADAAELGAAVAEAASRGQALEIVAGGSKRGLGRTPSGQRLDVSALNGILDYDPAELVVTVRAATPLADLQAALAAERQMLAFEPPDWAALFGAARRPTAGGVVACNAAGPRRVRAGAPRDHLLGFAAIDGRGQAWQAGGRVVKNVTGYDMGKLMAGSFGTLSVLTQLSLRTAPLPETEATLVLSAATPQEAVRILAQALNTPFEVSGAAWLPPRDGVHGALLRVEGVAPSVAWRLDALASRLGHGDRLPATASRALWHDVGAVAPVLPGRPGHIWRLCPAPALASAVLDAVQRRFASARAFLDWGGGLIWLSLDPEEAGAQAGAAAIRECLAPASGHATLFVAPETHRDAAFQPPAPAIAALQARIKRGFDPIGILNPGRMYPES